MCHVKRSMLKHYVQLQQKGGSFGASMDSHKQSKLSSVSDSKQTSQSSGDWGWGESDMSTFETTSKPSNKPAKGALKLGGQKKEKTDDFGWIEEEFAPIEDKSVKPASSYNWGEPETAGGNDFFSSMDSTSQVK